jgi:hypothetical protein
MTSICMPSSRAISDRPAPSANASAKPEVTAGSVKPKGLQVSLDAATAKLNSLSQAPANGRPHLGDLGLPVFTDSASPPQTDSNLMAVRACGQER